MNWDAIGAIAQCLGIVILVITLVLLSIEVREAKNQFKRSLQQARYAFLREIYLVPVQTPELASVLSKSESVCAIDGGIETEEELFEAAKFTTEEVFIWQSYQRACWVYWREVINNRNQLTKSQMDEVNEGILKIFIKGSSRIYLNSMRNINSPTIHYIKELLAKAAC
ncbi:hypothetical protein [Microbulbifer sp. PSTR4-B]|uniref:hypothetical protein n=1 Tax=Microbulbifer sp. PSTR4-B TaxID=3243396 RepID=UPI004039443A